MNLRISKYNPSYRDNNGNYNREEWTSVHDIGKQFAGKVLSVDEYLTWERTYVAFILCLFSSIKEDSVHLNYIEGDQRGWDKARKHAKKNHLDHILTEKIPALGAAISLHELSDIVRACMREFVWAKVEAHDLCTLRFGYDFYMYVAGTSVKSVHKKTASHFGLFAERIQKLPY